MQRVSRDLYIDPRSTWKTKGKRHRQKACSKTRGRIKVICCSQGKGLTVTSACDLGEMCHLGLYLLHAVTAQGMALPERSTREEF